MKLILFSTLNAALAEQLALDQAAGLPRPHSEGYGPDDYVIGFPGAAARRIRAAGIQTVHRCPVVSSADNTRHGVLAPDDPRAVEVDRDDWSRGALPRASPVESTTQASQTTQAQPQTSVSRLPKFNHQ